MAGFERFRFGSSVKPNPKPDTIGNPDALNSRVQPVARQMQELIKFMKQERGIEYDDKRKSAAQTILDRATHIKDDIKRGYNAPGEVEDLVRVLEDVSQRLVEYKTAYGKEVAIERNGSVSRNIERLRLESLQRDEILKILSAVQNSQDEDDDFVPAGKRSPKGGKGGGKSGGDYDEHKGLKREVLYTFLGPAGPWMKTYHMLKDEYGDTVTAWFKGQKKEDREEKELVAADDEWKETTSEKIDKVGEGATKQLKTLDARVTRLEKGAGSSADTLSDVADTIFRRKKKGGLFRKPRVLLKRKWRLFKRAQKYRLRKWRTLAKRRMRPYTRKGLNYAKAVLRKIRVVGKRGFRKLIGVRRWNKIRGLGKYYRYGRRLLSRGRRFIGRGLGGLRSIGSKALSWLNGAETVKTAGESVGFLSKLASKGGILGKVGRVAEGGMGLLGKAGKFLKGGGGLLGKAAGKSGVVGKLGGKLLGRIAAPLALYSLLTQDEAKSTDTLGDKAWAYGSGALDGATIGATIGSIVPGLGTVVGGAIGAALGVAYTAVRRNWTAVKGWVSKQWDSFKGFASGLWDSMKKRGEKFKEMLGTIWDKGAEFFKDFLPMLLTSGPLGLLLKGGKALLDAGAGAVKKAAGAAVGAAVSGSGVVDDAVAGVFDKPMTGGAVGQATAAVENYAGEVAAGGRQLAKDAGEVASKAGGVVRQGYNRGKKAVGDAVDAMTSAVSATGDALRDTILNSSFGQLFIKHEGKYDSVNRGKAGGYRSGREDLENMTVDEVMAAQAAQKFNAAGKYQIIKDTMIGARRHLKLTGKEKFNKELQDRIFADYLIKVKRPEIWAYLTGKSNDKTAFQVGTAKEWASVATPAGLRTEKGYVSDGRTSFYAGTANNKASLSADALGTEGERLRAAIMSGNIKAGTPQAGATTPQVVPSRNITSAAVAARQGRSPTVSTTQEAPAKPTYGERYAQATGMKVAGQTPSQSDNFSRAKSRGATPQPQAATVSTTYSKDATQYQRVPAVSPNANVTVSPPPPQPKQEQSGGMMTRIGAAFGLSDVPLVLGDNHMVVLNAGLTG